MPERTSMEAKVGPRSSADGNDVPIRATRDGSLGAQDTHGRYQEAVLRGSVFWAANTAATTTTVALATTYTGLVISNPAGSGKNMVLLAASWLWSAAPAAIASVHIGVGFTAAGLVTHTTPLAVNNALVGGGAGVGKADAAATLVGPLYGPGLIGGFTAGALPAQPAGFFDLGGLIILQPGAWAAIITLTVSVGFGFMAWEEINQ